MGLQPLNLDSETTRASPGTATDRQSLYARVRMITFALIHETPLIKSRKLLDSNHRNGLALPVGGLFLLHQSAQLHLTVSLGFN